MLEEPFVTAALVVEFAATVMAVIFLPVATSFAAVYLNDKLTESKAWKDIPQLLWVICNFLKVAVYMAMLVGAAVVAARYAMHVPLIERSGFRVVTIGFFFGFFQWFLCIAIIAVQGYRSGELGRFIASLEARKRA